MSWRRGVCGLLAVLLALVWLGLLVSGPLYLALTGQQLYRRAVHDPRLLPRLSAVLAVELAPRLPAGDTYRWVPHPAEGLQVVLEQVLSPEVLEPFLAHVGPQWFRWSIGHGPEPEPLSAAVRTYIIAPQQPLILDALWQALPPCAQVGDWYCRPDALPPAEQGYAYAALRSAWDTIEMDLYAHLNAWQARAVQATPWPIAPIIFWIWPWLALMLTLAMLALAPTRELSAWLGAPLGLAGLGALLVAWYLPAWAGAWIIHWGLASLSMTAQSYALTLAQVLLEEAAWGLASAAFLVLALALWGGLTSVRRGRALVLGGMALLALVAVALLVWLAQAPAGVAPQPTPTLWPSPTITLTPTATPYWPVQPGTPVPTPQGGLALAQPPQVVGCVQLEPEPVHALALDINTLTAVQSTATTLLVAGTLSPTAVFTHPMAAERALIPWPDQALLVSGTQARLFLLPAFTEIYTSHIPILSPIRVVGALPARLRVLLGLDEGRIWIVDATSGDADWSLWHINRHSAAITAMATHPAQPWVVSGAANGELWLWDVEAGQRLRTFSGHGAALTALAFSPDGAELLAADAAGQLILWDVARAEVLQRWSLPAGDRLEVLGWETPLALGGTRQGRLLLIGGETLWASQPQAAALTALDFHANRIATGLANGQVCLWTQVRP